MPFWRDWGRAFNKGFNEGTGRGELINSDYTNLSEDNNNPEVSDEEVWKKFENYCEKFDPEISDPNTIILMQRIFKQRPELETNFYKTN